MEKFPSSPPRSREETPRSNPPEVIQPKSFDNIKFELVRDGDGGIVGYKSSELGRKKIALSPDSPESLLFNLDLSQGYNVRVVGDSKPEDPEKGTYYVEIEGISASKEGPYHQEAQRARARHLKESASFQIVAQMINSDPDLSAEYHSVVARRGEYRDSVHQSDSERHRGFTGMLAGLMMSERGNNLLDRTIDLTVRERSNTIKQRLLEAPFDAPAYVPGVVVGAGVHGAVFATARQMELPDVPDLTIEAEERIGGQFAQYRSNLFRVNSRRRPELADAPHLPGTRQSLNSAGKYAVLQSSDTGHESYPHQSTISDTTRANFFLSGEAMTGSDISRIRQNTNSEAPGALILETVDRRTGQVYEVATDRIVFSTGIGEEADRLDPEDAATQRILKEEREKSARGEDARVRSFTEFTRAASDPRNPHPFKGMKRIVLSGGGDSANVIAGILLGYESQLGKSSSQLDAIEEIYWVGQDLATKEEFLECTRARYAQIGLEFPRDRFEKYYHRIIPVRGARSNRLRRTDTGGIEVYLSKNTPDSPAEKALPSGASEADFRAFRRRNELRADAEKYVGQGSIEGDYYIYAHGFVDRTDEIIAPAYNLISNDKFSISGELENLASFPSSGTEVYFKKGPFRRIRLKDTVVQPRTESDAEYLDRITITLETYTREGRYEEEILSGRDFSNRQAYFDTSNIDRIEDASSTDLSERSDLSFAIVRGKERPVARYYDSPSDVDNPREKLGQIYKAGPAAQLELSDEERKESPALAQISENTASIFRYVDLTEAFAGRIARNEKLNGIKPSPLLTDLSPADTVLPEPPRTTKKPALAIQVPIDSSMRASHAQEAVGLGENSLDLLKLSVGTNLANAVFPAGVKELSLTVGIEKSTDGIDELNVESGLLVNDTYNDLISDLIQDGLVSATVTKIASNVRSRKIKVTIPVESGRVVGSAIQYSAV